MNIKSLLLGSAAAFVAVSGARAADAVVMVEPEPAEYVRICDTYGTGFFYIPGTETCLKVGGYVRMRINASDNAQNTDIDLDNLNGTGLAGTITNFDGGSTDNNFVAGFTGDDYNVNTAVRARIDFDAREETELGMLRAFARVQATNNSLAGSGDGSIAQSSYVMDQAYVQLGGLTMGRLDSLWAERDGLFTDNDWSVGDISRNRVSYTFAVAGFTAAVSAEDDGSGDFVPDVVAQLAYEGGWGEAYVSGVYDEQGGNTINATQSFFIGQNATATTFALPNYVAFAITDTDPSAAFLPAFASYYQGDLNDNDDGAFALKAGVTLKDLIASGSQLKVEGSYAFDPTVFTGDGGGYLAPNGLSTSSIFQSAATGAFSIIDTNTQQPYLLSSEWQIGAGYQQQIDKLFLAASGVYGETFDLKNSVNVFDAAGNGSIQTTNLGNAEYWGVAGNVGYNITSNFSVLGEVSYREIDLPGLADDADTTAGFVEFKRTF